MVETGYASPHVHQSVRSLALTYAHLCPSILIPSSQYLLAAQIRDEFQAKYVAPSADAIEKEGAELEFEHELHLIARFLGLVASKEEKSPDQYNQLLNTITLEFERTFLAGNEVHAVVHNVGLSVPAQKDVVCYYYRSRALTGRGMKFHGSALLNDPSAKLSAIFGGQGYEDYFDELAELYEVYAPFASELVQTLSKFLFSLVQNEQASKVYSKGLNVLDWLAGERPERDYLVTAPVSLPLVGLTQLVQFYVTAQILGLNPGELASRFTAATGHSQGVIVAAAVSASTDQQTFIENAKVALTTLFWIGVRSQQVFPTTTLPPSVVADSVANSEGNPSPMLAVRDLPLEILNKHIEITNTHLPEDRRVYLSLVNGPKSFVVSGPARSLYGLNLTLRKEKADGQNQARIPHSKRKLRFVNRFLSISVPFHNAYLAPTRSLLEKDLKGMEFSPLRFPVYSTDDAGDLRFEKPSNLLMALSVMITEKVVHWEQACNFPETTHIVDFGPGGVSGVGAFTRTNKDGQGVRVIVADAFDALDLGSKTELFDREVKSVKFAPNWVDLYKPKLIKNKLGRVYVETRLSKMLGLPPLWVAGMTPTSVPWDFCSAVAKAGYAYELAGGGYFSAKMMRDAIHELSLNIPPGAGICINLIYINPRSFAWQIPLVREMVAEGYPIRGITIAAGIPSLEVANELIETLGVEYICLKPGSIEAINAVINIAKANPTFPIVMQWTGGRAGGHHSFEDFHAPILQTYSSVRRCDNIVLVAGSGFGGADDTEPYLTGEWTTAFKLPAMPFDGIMFGSRLMVAKEAHTSLGAKEAIVAAPGVTDAEWEKTYDGPAGGIVTVMSELGEPIHKLATRGIMFWKELDNTIFALPRPKRVPALLAKKQYIIKRLNDDFQKVYFPARIVKRLSSEKLQFEAVDGVEEMTYAEVLYRTVDLLYVTKEKRWIDLSLRTFTGNLMRRIEERFTKELGKHTLIENFEDLNDPYPVVARFLEAYPEANNQIMNTQDVQFFFSLCSNPLQKPVPFIPAIDDTFEYYFKKDSLWQSEDLGAVVGEDVGRVAILQGPMAVRHSTKVNEPTKELLDGIHEAHIKRFIDLYYNGDVNKVPTVEYFGGVKPVNLPSSAVDSVSVTKNPGEEIYDLPEAGSLPSAKAWFELLAGKQVSWRRAIFTTQRVAQGWKLEQNPVRRILAPRPGQRVVLKGHGNDAVLEMYELQCGEHVLAVRLSFGNDTITVSMFENRNALKKNVSLDFLFKYDPSVGYAPVAEIIEGRNDRIKHFYWQLWFANEPYPESASIADTFTGVETTITANMIEDFCRTVGNHNEAYTNRANCKRMAPMDFAIVVGWQAITKAIFPKAIDGDLLRLVHLSNSFRMVGSPLVEGDKVTTAATITGIVNNDSGKTVTVKGVVYRDNKEVIEVISRFLYRGNFTDFENTFEHTQETPMQLTLATPKDVAVLQSKSWFQLLDPSQDLSGSVLTFRLNSYVRFKNQSVKSSVQTKGIVLSELPSKAIIQIASVDFQSVDCHGNPVIDFLNRNAKPIEQPLEFESGGYSVIQTTDEGYSPVFITPPTNSPYADVSGDYNPIHVSPTFAAFVELPGSHGITHGMYSSAATRKFVETFAAENVPERVKHYEINFVNMVLPNSELVTKLSHTGMINGRKIIKVEVLNKETEEAVLVGTAEVEQPVSAYVFTGQGSQEQGMGMDLYATSAVAKKIWDSADKHFLSHYGFSIIDIVKNNPKDITIHFGGTKGKQIRNNYMAMAYEKINDDGSTSVVPVFNTITEESTSFTFTHPSGLLSATQFTQPALTLMEKAAFEDMRAKGLAQQDCAFAGHSLGEYSALSAMADVLSIEALVDLVFLRGLTMQNAVRRDDLGRSEYGMVAANPSRVSPTFTDAALRFIVDHIGEQTKLLLEIVNYNVENQQYVVSGNLMSLCTLGHVLNFLKVQKIDFQKLIETLTLDQLKEQLSEIVEGCHEKTLKQKEEQGHLELERGFATIPLKIDVPFHSSFLRGGVRMFREYLLRKISPHQINVSKLRGKYIPNLTAKPFEISKEYFQNVYELTGSQRIKKILQNWDQYNS
ncbi:fatty acid synthase beta subunit Fas1 [Schizosaccharomyces osmophilus]|uniref:Fatty acid synthase subunit beta n=1 Tax=Schizosaccharomyces osmophilus TaxID=2545709 RepID=A0AAE9WGZ4_9SCHI|nr:fatty acid synthase beta subunit Fas1 [Schizosaccharomyces osmophilus]WBW74907.1 fatty acid synthase beta subunit Fas1 [Schizosaccharomyces osmophilus]